MGQPWGSSFKGSGSLGWVRLAFVLAVTDPGPLVSSRLRFTSWVAVPPTYASTQLSATDVSARTTMKDAAKCDKHCELQNSVNQQGFERILRFRDIPESMPASVSTLCHASGSFLLRVVRPAARVCASGSFLPLTHPVHRGTPSRATEWTSCMLLRCLALGAPLPSEASRPPFPDMKLGQQTR